VAKDRQKQPNKKYETRTTVTGPATGACDGAVTEGACDSAAGCSTCPAEDEC